jgi:hypothetical protein
MNEYHFKSLDELYTFMSASVSTPSEYQYIYNKLKHNWRKEDGICPYCHADEQCVHWDGLGWTRDKTDFSYDLPNKE